jgi:hypothetical protein
MAYSIISELVGNPGDQFHPGEYINVEALIEGGFIKEDNKTTKTKSED